MTSRDTRRPEIREDETVRVDVPAPSRPVGAILRPIGIPDAAPYRLRAGKCVVGSGAGSDFVLPDKTVSRVHAELELVPEGVAIRDLESTNGTHYLGQRFEKMTLALGARVELGKATLVIDADVDSLEGEWVGDGYRGMVGTSPPMRRLFAMLARLEGSLVNVLVEGESGAGKELVARAIHEGSSVSSGPYVVLNCGSFSRELVASELFGHKKGAFTGAVDVRRGAFESADGGTLFLDEIGELPLDVQPSLLRALEVGEVRAIGSDQSKRVKVRIIAATNRDLSDEVRQGRFREDLFYRLAVVRLRVPPLRARPEDIEPLARKFAHDAGLDDLGREVLEQLKGRSWPGNARELRNAVHAFAALGILPDAARPARGGGLDSELSEVIDPTRPYAEQKEELVDRFTRAYLAALLARTGGNQSAAARLAGLDRGYLGRLVAKYGGKS